MSAEVKKVQRAKKAMKTAIRGWSIVELAAKLQVPIQFLVDFTRAGHLERYLVDEALKRREIVYTDGALVLCHFALELGEKFLDSEGQAMLPEGVAIAHEIVPQIDELWSRVAGGEHLKVVVFQHDPNDPLVAKRIELNFLERAWRAVQERAAAASSDQ